jgi:hypothetical protein
MRLVFGIVLLLVSLWLGWGVMRMWPPGTYRRSFLVPSTWRHIILGLVMATVAGGFGIFLLSTS